MSAELIKRIDDILFDRGNKGRETPVSTEELVAIRAALSQSEPVRYVPMADDELQDVWIKSGNLNGTETMRMMESAVIRGAIAQGAKLEVQE